MRQYACTTNMLFHMHVVDMYLIVHSRYTAHQVVVGTLDVVVVLEAYLRD